MSTYELAQHECVPCKGEDSPLSGETLQELYSDLGSDWVMVSEHHLEKEYSFDGYSPAVDFANAVAGVAEEQDHHPDILLAWGKVKVSIWTHKVGGLTPNDFYFAAKVEQAYEDV